MFDQITTVTYALHSTAGQLLAALKIAGRAVESKNSYPILGYVMFDKGRVTGTNLDMYVSADLEGITAPFLVEHKDLVKFLAGVEGHEIVTAEIMPVPSGADAGQVKFTCDGVSVSLDGLPVQDMPVCPAEDFGQPSIILNEDEFCLMLKTVTPCISTELTRYYLNGVYLHSPQDGDQHPHTMSMVATDGHRMAEVHTTHEYNGGDVIVPTACIKILNALISEKAKAQFVRLHIPARCKSSMGGMMKFKGTGWEIISKQVDGTFPDYTRVSAQKAKGMFTVPIKETTKALKRIIGMSDGSAVFVNPAQGTLTQKQIVATVGMEDMGGLDATPFGVNPKYLQAVLGIINLYGDTCTGYSGKEGAPVAFTPEHAAQPSWGTVQITQMPMRY